MRPVEGLFWRNRPRRLRFKSRRALGDRVSDDDVDRHYLHFLRAFRRFSPQKLPVLAFASAPAPFPVDARARPLQRYLRWSTRIERLAAEFVAAHLQRPFLGVHLRNGADWVRRKPAKTCAKRVDLQQLACNHVSPNEHFFASPTCVGENFEFARPSPTLCAPSKRRVLDDMRATIHERSYKSVFVSADDDHMISEMNAEFGAEVSGDNLLFKKRRFHAKISRCKYGKCQQQASRNFHVN